MFRIKNAVISISVCLLLILITATLCLSPSLAYFRALFDKQGINTVMVELIFDHLDFDDPEIKAAGYSDVDAQGNEIPWGSEKNPYVISQRYHIQNLSVLQNAGFFATRVQKDANGDPVLDAQGKTIPVQSYFRVCTPQGDPVTVDCGGITIAPVGTHDNPFTGVLHGAIFEGTSTYKNYGTSVSTIANLTVESDLDEPDIGFFGRLGYYGTYNEETVTVSDGFSANIDNLLFADVTIKSQKSLFNTLTDWWNSFTSHVNRVNDVSETHHVGIIAGHAEFAVITRASVYYSEGVEAFNLVSNANGSNTNYYSSTGLIGLLEYVNPNVDLETGTIDGSSAVTDSDIIGLGNEGGGGSESGTLTGYFLAKNLFERHEDYLTAHSMGTQDSYNVMEMKDVDGSGLFKTVTMREREAPLQSWNYRNYFFFQDTVFTFAMSMSVASGEDGVPTESADPQRSDYVQVIWPNLDENNRPSISATDSFDKLQYGPDPTATPQISYHLQAVESGSLTNDAYYVLAYVDGKGTDDKSDDTLYLLNLNDIDGTNGYVKVVEQDEINGDIEYFDEKNGGGIKSIDLIGISQIYYDYAFQYGGSGNDNNTSIKKPDSQYKFGITAKRGSGLNITFGNAETTLNASDPAYGYAASPAYYYNWTFTPVNGQSGKFTIAKVYKVGITTNFWSKLTFNTDNKSIGFVSQKTSTAGSYDEYNYFTVLSLQTNTLGENGNLNNNDLSDNEMLGAKNILPTAKDDGNGTMVPDTIYDFDPSKYVLQFVETSTEGGYNIGNYRLVPIRSLKLNDGKGDLLSEINHVAKLYQAAGSNIQWTIGNIFGGTLGNWIDEWSRTNSGGVLSTTIGTQDDEIYSIPMGMIAFEINEASASNPSYINIIVKVNPEQETPCKVGLWEMNKKTWGDSFRLDNPSQSFALPVSKTAKSVSDKQFVIKITERVIEEEDSGKKVYYTALDDYGNAEISYMYLGGSTALVYHTFEVTSPGVYMLGSQAGPLSIAYFSVSGAAGKGEDGTSGSPIGSIDFVYDYNGQIITTDKPYIEDKPLLSLEDYNTYYPSYLFVSMVPQKPKDQNEIVKIQNEVIRIRRYININDSSGTRRHFYMSGQDKTELRSASPMLQDMQDDID